MSNTFVWSEKRVDELTALDLQEAVKTDGAAWGPVVAFSFQRVGEDGYVESGEAGEGIYLTGMGRMGIAWGADASWADVDGLEAGISTYINEPDEWEQRN